MSLTHTEFILTGIGADTALTFAHASAPGAKGVDFRFTGAFAPIYPATESHLVAIDFEWGSSHRTLGREP